MSDIKSSKFYEFFKRLTDILLSILGLFILSPLFILIAVLITLSSRGPILYRGIRTGLNSTPFEIYKFRTMNNNNNNNLVTAKNDARITRFGSILRKYKLDELPQLANVLKGEMSLVGPRPEVELYTSLYTKEEKVILSVLPGITDFSSIYFVQLSDFVGHNDNNKEFQNNIKKVLKKKNKLRIKYVNERSYKTDMKILLKTLVRLIKIS
jgi:lipopolysaccharide/colanic/teichoic acid biosynthesis glycosyltransferase